MIQVNPAALGFVCNLGKNLVQKILTDLFAAFIELSRRTQSEVILDFKVGVLHLYKNGEIQFESKAEMDSNSPQRRQFDPAREDISVIDSASAILSSGGGRVMSIKSSYLENLSVRTPQSQYSKASSGFSQRSASNHQNKLLQSQNWLKYRVRQKYESATRDHSQEAPGAAPPNDETLPAAANTSLPYPYLAAFIERRTGKRFTKRVKFDPSQTDQEKLLSSIISQINNNSEKKDMNLKEKKEQDQEFLANLRQKIMLDQQQYHDDKR
jgi:hypothetical protein